MPLTNSDVLQFRREGWADACCVYAAAEMDDLRGAVMSLREALTALAANTDPAQEGVLKLNINDAQASLARRLQQLTPAVLVMQVTTTPCAMPALQPPQTSPQCPQPD